MGERYDERDDKSGQFRPEFDDDDFIDAVEATSGTTAKVADEVGCKYRTAYARLQDLADEGRVESTKVGPSLLWSVAEPATQDADPGGNAADPPMQTSASDRDVPDDVFERGEFTESVPSDVDREELLDAIEAARAYLEHKGAAKKPEFVIEVMPDHPLKYDAEDAVEKIREGERYRGKWWRLVRDGLASLDDVEKPTNAARPWRYYSRR